VANVLRTDDTIRADAMAPTTNYVPGGGSVTITTTGKYYPISNGELSFTPAFVGQRFLCMFNGSIYSAAAEVRTFNCAVRITDSANTTIVELGITSEVNFVSAANWGHALSLSAVWTADAIAVRKLKLYVTKDGTNGIVMGITPIMMTVLPIP
jgi:hypothetical protein